VLFAGPAERLVLSHQATDRAIFARGAVAAAGWLAGKPPGRFEMRDFIVSKTMT
jgi:4-hydroxy-tetrahydrodipicolinate reductase